MIIPEALFAQEIENNEGHNRYSIYAGLYSPYVIQPGIRLGLSIPFKSWNSETRKSHRINCLDVVPRFAFFSQPDIQQNYFTDLTVEYRRYNPNKGLNPKVGIGLGYMFSLQNVEGSVNLANGSVEFNQRSLNSIVPTINIGFERNRKGKFGYYFTFYYGGKFTSKEVNSAFIGLETGVSLNLSNKK